jgi:hypothetical protein
MTLPLCLTGSEPPVSTAPEIFEVRLSNSLTGS